MISVRNHGVWLINGTLYDDAEGAAHLASTGRNITHETARDGTMAYSVLRSHDTGHGDGRLRLRFDCLASHDISFVSIVQTARASGLERFPVPYVMTNCHSTLCAVGGTINEDDHVFGLSAAKRYGGIFVPPHMAVIHSYVRERHAACGAMILGSDSHTRYGALGTMGIGEGGGELVKQILGKTYDVARPQVVAVYMTGRPGPGVGPHDVALALVGAVFKDGVVKNKVLEFIGEGVASLPMDFRNGIDTMTTETACLSSIWRTDDTTKAYLTAHGRAGDFRPMEPADVAYYDAAVEIDLSTVEPMIALPFHPSNAYPIRTVLENPGDLLRQVELDANDKGIKLTRLTDKVRDGNVYVDQGIIAGCAGGTFDNIMAAADILSHGDMGNAGFSFSAYPSSQPVMLALSKAGAIGGILTAGGMVRTAFCGPCFGAGDTPANNGLSIRHVTRNFPNREGAKPGKGQAACVALMDARSIAATAANGGRLTSAAEIGWEEHRTEYHFDETPYAKRVYSGFDAPDNQCDLVRGPNITDWPAFSPLPMHALLGIASRLDDPVTTTDELVPSGDTSSYRSNPLAMAEFTLSRRDAGYVARAKAYRAMEDDRQKNALQAEAQELLKTACALADVNPGDVGFGSTLLANCPGDGSAREQAASCQRVLGGLANVAKSYATKRYRSNLINWGMLPFTLEPGMELAGDVGDALFIPNIRKGLLAGDSTFKAYLLHQGAATPLTLSIGELDATERAIIAAGCLMNHYKN